MSDDRTRSTFDIIFKPSFRRRVRDGLGAVGLAAALTAGTAAVAGTAQAQDVVPFGEVGAFLGWTWDLRGGGGFTWGIEGRGGVDFREQFACDAAPAFTAAGVARFSFVDLDPQLHFGGQAGMAMGIFSGVGDITAGYRWGDNGGFSFPIGLELQVFAGSTYFRGDAALESLSAGIGGFVPPRDGSLTCAVAGRALHDEAGHAPLPTLARLDDGAPLGDLPVDVAEALALEWEARAKAEWASVPAFLQLAEQLRLAGAPETLVARALGAADDELRHAVATARAAMCYSGAPVALGRVTPATRPFARGADALVRLAVESWVDGCQGEGTAARAAAIESTRVDGPELAAMNATIARDEARHAALAWDVLAWSIEAGGDDVRDALFTIRDARSPISNDATPVDLAPHGLLDARARAPLAEALHEVAVQHLDHLLA